MRFSWGVQTTAANVSSSPPGWRITYHFPRVGRNPGDLPAGQTKGREFPQPPPALRWSISVRLSLVGGNPPYREDGSFRRVALHAGHPTVPVRRQYLCDAVLAAIAPAPVSRLLDPFPLAV